MWRIQLKLKYKFTSLSCDVPFLLSVQPPLQSFYQSFELPVSVWGTVVRFHFRQHHEYNAQNDPPQGPIVCIWSWIQYHKHTFCKYMGRKDATSEAIWIICNLGNKCFWFCVLNLQENKADVVFSSGLNQSWTPNALQCLHFASFSNIFCQQKHINNTIMIWVHLRPLVS